MIFAFCGHQICGLTFFGCAVSQYIGLPVCLSTCLPKSRKQYNLPTILIQAISILPTFSGTGRDTTHLLMCLHAHTRGYYFKSAKTKSMARKLKRLKYVFALHISDQASLLLVTQKPTSYLSSFGSLYHNLINVEKSQDPLKFDRDHILNLKFKLKLDISSKAIK